MGSKPAKFVYNLPIKKKEKKNMAGWHLSENAQFL